MRFLTIFIFLMLSSFSLEASEIKNLIIYEEPKKYNNLSFLDDKNNELKLNSFKGNVILLNFWATWCAPCKEEMPSLDLLQENNELNNLKIFPINIGKDNLNKASSFFKNLKIRNLNLYFDNPETLAKKLSLRGIPTTILFNKKGDEFARIVGSIDFSDQKFLDWLRQYN